MFPGWKSPFSNTLGYFIAFLSGIKPAFLKLLKKPESIDASNIEDKALLESINHIYNDVSTMINELNTQKLAFEATISGNFNISDMPTDKNLELKVGAQVMMIKNGWQVMMVQHSLQLLMVQKTQMMGMDMVLMLQEQQLSQVEIRIMSELLQVHIL